MSPVFMSHWTTFLSAIPQTATCCLSSCGWSRPQCATLPVVTAEITFPVSVSQSFTILSNDVERKRRPSLLKQMSFTAWSWPMYVRMHLPEPLTSQILILVSMPADSRR